VIGTLQVHLGAGLAALFGAVLTAAYFLGLYRRAFLGPMSSAVVAAAVDLQPRELALAGILAALVLLAGLYPAAVLELTRPAVEAGSQSFHPRRRVGEQGPWLREGREPLEEVDHLHREGAAKNRDSGQQGECGDGGAHGRPTGPGGTDSAVYRARRL